VAAAVTTAAVVSGSRTLVTNRFTRVEGRRTPATARISSLPSNRRIRNGRNLGERVDLSLTSRQRRPLDEINLAIADLRRGIGVRTVLEMGP
jgi:hypothetical protein